MTNRMERNVPGNTQQIASQLNKFQMKALIVVSSSNSGLSGQEIKGMLNRYYTKELNHGQLYSNLDILSDTGLIQVSKRDGRTNEYSITGRGNLVVELEYSWVVEKIGDSDE